jgi:hypothetical protein
MVDGQAWNRTMEVAVFIQVVLVFFALSGARLEGRSWN